MDVAISRGHRNQLESTPNVQSWDNSIKIVYNWIITTRL